MNKKILKCTFVSKRFSEIRIVYDNNEVYFSSKDVCSALGITEHYKAINKFCDTIHRYRHETKGGKQTMNFIDYMDVIHLYYHARNDENASDFLEYLARICVALKGTDVRLPEYLATADNCSESDYQETDDYDEGYDYADDYDPDCDCDDDFNYCTDCDDYDDCCCDGDCDSCDECFDCDETDEYEAPVFDVEKVLEEIGDMVRSFEKKYGIIIAVEGIYSEYPSGERHRVA